MRDKDSDVARALVKGDAQPQPFGLVGARDRPVRLECNEGNHEHLGELCELREGV